MGIITDILKEIPLSAVLRELLVSQEIKMADLEVKVAVLEAENSDLKAELAKSQKENEELQSKIKQYENAAKHPIPDKAETDFDVFNH